MPGRNRNVRNPGSTCEAGVAGRPPAVPLPSEPVSRLLRKRAAVHVRTRPKTARCVSFNLWAEGDVHEPRNDRLLQHGGMHERRLLLRRWCQTSGKWRGVYTLALHFARTQASLCMAFATALRDSVRPIDASDGNESTLLATEMF